MITMSLITGLQIVSAIITALILYMAGFLHGMHWKRRNEV